MPQSAINVASIALDHLMGEDRNIWLARSEELKLLGEKLARLS